MGKKIVTIVGARPQFIKAASISRALRAAGLREVMIHTGQHFDPNMSDLFFAELEIPAPAHHLDIHGGNHGQMTGRMLEAIEDVLEREKPDIVLVFGDTNSTLAGALAAAKLHMPVVHVEAGLRSFNKKMPEEINRILTDHVSTALFCPTRTAIENLANEGIREGVYLVGDVMFDASLHAKERAEKDSSFLTQLGLTKSGFALATIHRAENTSDKETLSRVVGYLKKIVASGMPVVWPVHPRTEKAAQTFGVSLEGLTLCPPVGYLAMAQLLNGCAQVLTDSGGVQKEAYFYRKPCVTLRSETEWVETVEAGWNRLWTVPDYVSPRQEITDYGAGDSAQRIVSILGSL